MFLVRYFLYAGSVLLALFFIADWYWPAASSTADQVQAAAVDKSILRIHSAQKWPQKIVFDTNIPTIVPAPALIAKAPSPPAPFKTAEAPSKAKESVLNARAEAKPAAEARPARAKAPVRRVAVVRHRIYRPAPAPFGAYPVASAWSPWW